jgi:hypothetical protein
MLIERTLPAGAAATALTTRRRRSPCRTVMGRAEPKEMLRIPLKKNGDKKSQGHLSGAIKACLLAPLTLLSGSSGSVDTSLASHCTKGSVTSSAYAYNGSVRRPASVARPWIGGSNKFDCELPKSSNFVGARQGDERGVLSWASGCGNAAGGIGVNGSKC